MHAMSRIRMTTWGLAATLLFWAPPSQCADPYVVPRVHASLSGNVVELGIDESSVVSYVEGLLTKNGIPTSAGGEAPCLFEVSLLATRLHAIDNPDQKMAGEVVSVYARASRYIDGGCFVYWEQSFVVGAIGVSDSFIRNLIQQDLDTVVQQFAVAYHQSRAR